MTVRCCYKLVPRAVLLSVLILLATFRLVKLKGCERGPSLLATTSNRYLKQEEISYSSKCNATNMTARGVNSLEAQHSPVESSRFQTNSSGRHTSGVTNANLFTGELHGVESHDELESKHPSPVQMDLVGHSLKAPRMQLRNHLVNQGLAREIVEEEEAKGSRLALATEIEHNLSFLNTSVVVVSVENPQAATLAKYEPSSLVKIVAVSCEEAISEALDSLQKVSFFLSSNE